MQCFIMLILICLFTSCAGSLVHILKSVIICLKENYRILREYIKCVLPPLTYVVGSTIYLISRTHHLCEKREYTFNVLPEYYG